MRGYSLVLSTPVAQVANLGVVSAVLADVTNEASDWRRSTRLQGGYWSGSFTLPLTPTAFNGFETWMGAHITERSGGQVSWEGMVYEMELSQGGMVRRRSYDWMSNRVRVDYTNEADDETESDWAENLDSQASHGIKEEVLTTETTIQAEAEAYRDLYLSRHAWPWEFPISTSPPLDNNLTVRACGYIFTANWQCVDDTEPLEEVGGLTGYGAPAPTGYYTGPGAGGVPPGGLDVSAYATDPADGLPARYTVWTNSDNATTAARRVMWAYLGEVDVAHESAPGAGDALIIYKDVDLTTPGYNGEFEAAPTTYADCTVRGSTSIWIQSILASDSEFLVEGVVDESYAPVARDNGTPERGWDAFTRCVDLGGYGDTVWRIWATRDRSLNYNEVSTAPIWYYRDGHWLDATGNEINPWHITPGVVRNLSWKFSVTRDGYWIEDPRDFLVEEFEVNAKGEITPRILTIADEEIMAYRLAAARRMPTTPVRQFSEAQLQTGWWYFNPETGQFLWYVEGSEPTAPWLWTGVQQVVTVGGG